MNRHLLGLSFVIAVWAVTWLTYGDVLYQIQMQNFWISGPRELYIAVTHDTGILSYLCHGAITIFAYPCLGSLEIACMALLLALLTDAVFRPGDRYAALDYIPSFAFLALCYGCGSDMYLETGYILPFEMFFVTASVLLIASIIRRFFKKAEDRPANGRCMAINASALALALLACVMYGYRNPQFRELTRIRYLMDKGLTAEAADLAERSSGPTRPLAAYHAMALADMDMLGDRLFDMSYGFSPIGFSDTKRNEGNIYSAEITLRSGLVLPAYHLCMEQMVMYGVTKWRLEFMTKCAVLSGERQLAEKYLSILSRMPFEGGFTEEYSRLAANPGLIPQKEEFSRILQLSPNGDSFEQTKGNYQFASHLANLGRKESAAISAAACLYLKDLERFRMYMGHFRGTAAPKSFQHAIVMLSLLEGNGLLRQYNIGLEALDIVNGFTNTMMEHSSDPDRGKSALGKYERTFMYYESFENIAN